MRFQGCSSLTVVPVLSDDGRNSFVAPCLFGIGGGEM